MDFVISSPYQTEIEAARQQLAVSSLEDIEDVLQEKLRALGSEFEVEVRALEVSTPAPTPSPTPFAGFDYGQEAESTCFELKWEDYFDLCIENHIMMIIG